MSDFDVQDEAMEPEETISVRLVRAREAKGLSQKEVADELFLTTTFIRYIDEGEFAKIPKPAFIKGYLRSYARVVSLPGDEIIAAFERQQDIAPQAPRILDVTESTSPPTGFGGPIIQTGVIGLAALLIVGALVWWLASDEAPPPVVTMPDNEDVSDAAGASDSGTNNDVMTEPGEAVEAGEAALASTAALEQEPQSTAPASTIALAADVPDAENTNADSGAASEAADVVASFVDEPLPDANDAAIEEGPDVQIERVTEGGTTYITVYASGETEMAFEFNDECWIEITDGIGDQIYADLNREGDVMTVYGTAPFDVLLGRAPAVAMMYQGERIDLSRFTTRDDTARVRTARL